MKGSHTELEDLVPLELKLRLLEAELEQLNSDADWIAEQRNRVLSEIQYFENLIAQQKRHSTLRRVK